MKSRRHKSSRVEQTFTIFVTGENHNHAKTPEHKQADEKSHEHHFKVWRPIDSNNKGQQGQKQVQVWMHFV